jgi:hypothetical protein
MYSQPFSLVRSPSFAQEYVLTLWNEIENSRLLAIEKAMVKHKKMFRQDILHNPKADTSRIMTSMPSTFYGGPSYFCEEVGAAIYAAGRLGCKNIVFTAFTTNAKWQCVADLDVKKCRPPHPTSSWDLTVRAFIAGRGNLRKMMKKGTLLPPNMRGKLLWTIESMETQLRGLLHCHWLDCYGW